MGIIAWIILGLIAGLIAKKVMPGDGPGGIIVTILLGIAGALLGGFLGSALFGVDAVDGFFEISTWVAAIIGAVILLFLYQLLTGRRSRV
ncbi:GlsB/YeaQ/YmgE family stress response membrane protein [Streptomyces sp. ST2-7A]|uniref:GlsB/YeaQ/YmgE family stress response membrane protein n=1 Tax=Streptomyces sp. ST2-7A TaxID=2907214 RepID=UPI001F3BE157|nr:GlsB/YeaQ/YmgE family stress response membrane protein [Streptomyces sp. ST2-7A]MCE7082664.1 GlsB/YeaQ/YmgE family stress response membrane protein [Streptomyces sp. ST2-7A]